MPADRPAAAPRFARLRATFLRFSEPPSARAEVAVWIALVLVAIGIRAYLAHLLPCVLWSKDAGSYVHSAVAWVEQGTWETDPRRGPVYSLLIAACLRLFGSFDSLMFVQHALGAAAVVAAMLVLRAIHGRAALIPFGLCSYAYAVYGLPIHLEHLLRNETLLFFFGTLAFVAWFCAIRRDSLAALCLSGFAAGCLMLTKNVFGPFPLLVIGGVLFFRREKIARAVLQASLFIVAFALPLIGDRALHALTLHTRPPEPQAGILLYGRTAQFTRLDGGIEPDIKRDIADEVRAYQRLPKLDNNIILKRTVVPHLRQILAAQGKTPADVNHLCMALAKEAIANQPVAYARQGLGDLVSLLFHVADENAAPDDSELRSVRRILAKAEDAEDAIRLPGTVDILDARIGTGSLRPYQHWLATAWLFRLWPVFFTTLLLPVFFFRARGEMRAWWFGAAGVWAFTLVLLCTVGRPMDRYMIAVAPIMFWTLSSAIIELWKIARRACMQPSTDC